MRFDVLTLFPQMVAQLGAHSIIKRALERNLIEINAINPRDFSTDKHHRVDAPPYGGGAGMVLMCQPFFDAINSVEKMQNSQTILLTPQGERYDQKIAKELAQKDQLILICGHYEGFDERIRMNLLENGARQISIGDYILTGGELPALCIIDSTTRLIEGVLGNSDSYKSETFTNGLVEYPQYTKPREYNGMLVPEVLLNGNHKEIEKWKYEQQILKSKKL